MLTFTEFSGSPYQTGLALGKFGAPAVHDILTASPAWEQLMQWRNTDTLHAMQHLTQAHHPYIWDELQGLARGLELPPEDVFLWNCRADLLHQPRAHSTTVMMLAEQGPRILHSVYVNPDLNDFGSIAEFDVEPGPAYAAFVEPGSLPGHAFAVTQKGLALTLNPIPSEDTAVTGLPLMVLSRAVLNAPDLSSAIALLQNSPRAGSGHLCLAQRGGSALLSIEFNPVTVSVQTIKTCAIHGNHPTHDAKQEFTENTDNAPHNIRQHPPAPPDNIPDASTLQKLAQQLHTTEPAASRTLATADIHVRTDVVEWDIYEYPDEPIRFKMQDATHI